MKKLAKPKKHALLLVVAITLAGCVTTMDTSVIDTSCAGFEPITWSAKDTADSIRQIKEHNAVFKALCQK